VFTGRTNLVGDSKSNVLPVALVVIGAIAMYNWMVRPHVSYLHAVQRLEPVVGQMADERDRICGTLDARLERLRAMRRELAEVRGGLFTRDELKGFIPDLQSLVEQTGCAVVMADFSDGTETRPARGAGSQAAEVKASRANLTVLGRYDQIITLLERLRSNRRKVYVDSCRLELSDARLGQLKCQLALTTYAVLESGEADR